MRRPSWRGRHRLRAAVVVEPTRMHVRDLLGESFAGLLQRPGRAALTALGTVLGVGAFVAVLGLTVTAGGAINARFDATAATEVGVTDASPDDAAEPAFPTDADRRIGRVNGVLAGGVFWTVDPKRTTAASTRPALTGRDTQQITLVAATPGMLLAAQLHLLSGRAFDDFHNDHEQPVAMVSQTVAARLHITPLDTRPVIFVNGTALSVIGVYDAVQRRPELLLSAVVPARFAERVWGPPTARDPAAMVISTRLGAAQQVASQAAVALRPDVPQRLQAAAPPDPRTLRDQVNAEVNTLLVVLAALSLVVGSLGIANSTLVAVMERVGEIGLRRSVGARPRHIAAQFLLESVALGTLGGILGAALGAASVVGLSLLRHWTPLMEPGVVALAPAIGSAVGLIAGVYPAWRASRIEPVDALRR